MWDTENYAPGSDYLAIVIATDGVNSGEDVSDSTFSLVIPMPDDDGDGVSNDIDQCLETAEDDYVNVDGCSIADLCPCLHPILETTDGRIMANMFPAWLRPLKILLSRG